MRIAIVYTSVTGNTEELAEIMKAKFQERSVYVELFPLKDFPMERISQYDGLVIGTYTWANGSIPGEMLALYEELESADMDSIPTAVFGSGDSFFPHFCGAVDEFRDMLYVQSDLAVTMKVELRPQSDDVNKCDRFVDCLLEKASRQPELV
ncbi:flavodoxin domain-containing protein [Lentibacillus sp. N15]|uniref:flavodoxin domain-containing protein n=1 Tax=Lentibacillus songyuanensis TaxID=3136161 RepID=UPI0031BBCD85